MQLGNKTKVALSFAACGAYVCVLGGWIWVIVHFVRKFW